MFLKEHSTLTRQGMWGRKLEDMFLQEHWQEFLVVHSGALDVSFCKATRFLEEHSGVPGRQARRRGGACTSTALLLTVTAFHEPLPVPWGENR